jgi:hypothetical protein
VTEGASSIVVGSANEKRPLDKDKGMRQLWFDVDLMEKGFEDGWCPVVILKFWALLSKNNLFYDEM